MPRRRQRSDGRDVRASGRVRDLLRHAAIAAALGVIVGCTAAGRQLPPKADDYHYANGRFHNIGTLGGVVTEAAQLGHALRIQFGLFAHARELPADHVLASAKVHDGLRRSARSKLAVTWIGHSTTLIRIGDKWVLTDPAMLDSIGFGPFQVKRLAPAQPSIDELPKIDAILISHGDHDHLDVQTLRRLARDHPEAAVYVPLRIGPIIRKAGFRDVREMDWFGRDRLGDVEVTAVPAIHGHRRPPDRLDAKLWGGWVLKRRDLTLYFSGDTAFGPVFKDIRRAVGPVDVALVPIGAYTPRALQKHFHTTPEEAAEVARVLDAPIAIGMHWGTFPLSGEPPVEQKSRFLAATGRGVSTRALSVGETLVLR